MKRAIFVILSSVLMMSCSEEDEIFTVNATIDNASYSFECNRTSTTADEFSISCSNGNARRLTLTKGLDSNAGDNTGILTIEYTDVPNTALFDTAYGINYVCNDSADIDPTYNPMCASVIPTYNDATKTFTAANVEVTQTFNRTTEAGGTYVAGDASHTISVSVVMSDVPFFQ